MFPIAFTVHPNEAAKEFSAPRLPAAASAGSPIAFATDLGPCDPLSQAAAGGGRWMETCATPNLRWLIIQSYHWWVIATSIHGTIDGDYKSYSPNYRINCLTIHSSTSMTSFIPYHPQTQGFLDKKPCKQTFTKILLTENVPKEKHALSLQNKKILHLVEAQETSWLAQENLFLILRNTPNQNAIYKIDHLMKFKENFQQWNPKSNAPQAILP